MVHFAQASDLPSLQQQDGFSVLSFCGSSQARATKYFLKLSDRQPTEGRTPWDEEQEEQSQLSDGEHGRAGLESWWRTVGERKSFSS